MILSLSSTPIISGLHQFSTKIIWRLTNAPDIFFTDPTLMFGFDFRYGFEFEEALAKHSDSVIAVQK